MSHSITLKAIIEWIIQFNICSLHYLKIISVAYSILDLYKVMPFFVSVDSGHRAIYYWIGNSEF